MNPTTARQLKEALREHADEADAVHLQRFFKTGKGDYGEGDAFLGVRVPALRGLVKQFPDTPRTVALALLRSRWHEERLLALLLLVRRYERGDATERAAVFQAYLAHTHRINNWDLVDLSAPNIVGEHLRARARTRLDRLAASDLLWERRIAIVATFAFIRRSDTADTMRIAERLLGDQHDLIHKATGWMLREAGKRDLPALEAFLERHGTAMPRTMLRYAIEKFPEPSRKAWLARRKT